MTIGVAFVLWQEPQALTLLERLPLRNILEAALVILLAWAAIRWTEKLVEFMGQRTPRARFFFNRLQPVIRVGLWMGALLLCVNLLAPSREAFWTGLASVGLALGLGAQDLVRNVIGGLKVIVDLPYQLGDRVKVGDAYGEIDHIGLLSTKLTTPDDTRVTIPNSDILTGKVFNANSGVPDCQVVTDIHLPPVTDVTAAVRIGYEAAYSSPFLLSRKPVLVLAINSFSMTPSLTVRVKAYVFDHRFEPRMQSDITIRAMKEYERRGYLLPWANVAPPALPRA